MKILDYINNKTNNAYKDFKLVSVIFDEKTTDLTFKFLYKDECLVEDKDTLKRLIEEYVKEDINVIIKCKKAYVDCELVKSIINNYINKHYASVCVNFDCDNIDVKIDNTIMINIKCNEFQYNYLNSPAIKKDIFDYISNFFFEDVSLDLEKEVSLEEINVDDTINEQIFYQEENSNVMKYNKVTEINNFVGEVSGAPLQITCVKGPMQNVEIVGKIQFFTEKSFESKRKDAEGKPIVKTYYSFNLSDKTGKMNCVYFPNKADSAKAVSLSDGQTIIVHGDIEEFNGRINCRVKAIAYCEIVEEVEMPEVILEIKEPNEDYIFIKPEPYIELIQDNLFATHDKIGDYLLNNDVVVFDIETTGLEASRCEILEIGAVKLHNGKITETFETLIKPNGEIPEEITDLTGISYDMVVDAPSINQVIPDFYKFCYNTTIIAYNIDFDYKFINLFGKKYGYSFNMEQIDAMFLARAYIPGLKNFKLSSVCKRLGVSLENAHRAVHDALATAEVVIKLSDNIT